LEFYNDFVTHLNGRGFSVNTAGDNIRKLKAVMAAAMELDYHKNSPMWSFSLMSFNFISCNIIYCKLMLFAAKECVNF
jgi:Phage integrase SAM-like domain